MAVSSPLKRHGGKAYLAADIRKLFTKHTRYVEPFFGSGAVMLAGDGEGVAEYANDLDMTLSTFWYVMASEHLFEKFYRRIEATEFGKPRFEEACKRIEHGNRPQHEIAVEFFVVNRQSRQALGRDFATPTSRLRRGMNEQVSAWLTAVEGLPAFHARVKRVEVRCEPAVQLIKKLDSPETLFYCLHPTTRIRMADERLIPICEVQKGDVLAGGRAVKAAMKRRHSGEILRVAVQGLPEPLLLTADHWLPRIPKRVGRQETRDADTLWAARQIDKAGDIECGDYLTIPLGGQEREVEWNWNDDARKQGVRRDTSFVPSPLLFRFLGYYAAEGHIQRTNDIASGVLLSFSAAERDSWVADAAECVVNSFGVVPDIGPGPHESVSQVRVWSTSVAEFVDSLVIGTATDKMLGQTLMTAPIECQRQLLIGWLRGDGGLEIASRNRVKLLGTSASRTLAEQMFQIALRCGLRPSFKVRAGRAYDVYFAAEDALALGWLGPCKRFCSTRRIVNGHILSRVKSVIAIPYFGDVYDLDVDGDDCFCAPHVLVHNCDPPYVHETRSSTGEYKHEMTVDGHKELLSTLGEIEGKFILSGYDCKLYEQYAAGHGWRRVDFDLPNNASSKAEKERKVECVWMNY